jgi:tripartite-type tricarboxylate transporter receptor subunit TctC
MFMALSAARLIAPLVALLAAFVAPRPVAAQDYPVRPIQLIVPTSPGGTLDLSSRMLAPLWSEFLGQPVVIQNRAGGASAIGTRAVAQAAPDGYTLLVASDSSFVTVPLTRNDTGYTLDSFTMLFSYGVGSLFVAVNAASPYHSLADVAEAARRDPGKLTYASYGIASLAHFGGTMLWRALGVDVAHIPYRSTAEANVALLGRQVDIGITGSLGGSSDASRVRVLATSAPQRLAFAPQVPTMRELGHDVELGFTNTVAGPRGLPPAVTARLLAAHRAVMEKYGSTLRERLLAAELTPVDLDGATALAGMRQREARFRAVLGAMSLQE